MALPDRLSGIILDTILAHLAPLFLVGAAGDMTAARQAAAILLAAYHPETEDELCLAAHIVSFSFNALEALNQAAAPDLPPNRALRLRGSAVSLSRESQKAQRRLDEHKIARDQGVEPPADSPMLAPAAEKAFAMIDQTRKVAAVARAEGISWTQAYQQRQRAARIAENLKKNQARHAAGAPGAPPA